MCNLRAGLMQRGREEGREEGLLYGIKNLMRNTKVTVNDAMSMLGIPQDQRAKYAAMI